MSACVEVRSSVWKRKSFCCVSSLSARVSADSACRGLRQVSQLCWSMWESGAWEQHAFGHTPSSRANSRAKLQAGDPFPTMHPGSRFTVVGMMCRLCMLPSMHAGMGMEYIVFKALKLKPNAVPSRGSVRCSLGCMACCKAFLHKQPTRHFNQSELARMVWCPSEACWFTMNTNLLPAGVHPGAPSRVVLVWKFFLCSRGHLSPCNAQVCSLNISFWPQQSSAVQQSFTYAIII